MLKARYLFFVTFSLLFYSNAEAQIDHTFFELKHGMTMEQVYELFQSKEGLTPNTDLSSTESFIYTNSNIEVGKVPYIKLDFVDNKYHTGRIFITPTRAHLIFKAYDQLKADLISWFGKPNLDEQKIFPPYNKYKEYEKYFAVNNQLVLYHCKWDLYKKKGDTRSVEMYIDDCAYIIILMQDLVLKYKADEQKYSKTNTLKLLDDL